MKIFFDTEFTGLHKNTTLISIGCVDEKGRTFYGEFNDYDKNQVDEWIQRNVIDNLIDNLHGQTDKGDNWYIIGKKEYIKEKLVEWMSPYKDIQFVSDVCHYDFVLLIDLFGTAFDLPFNISPYCHDINQDIADFCNISDKQAFDVSREELISSMDMNIFGMKHNSLYDAQVIKAIYNIIQDKCEDKKLKDIVYKELDACGYFMGDYNIHGIKHDKDWKPYSSNSFGKMLMDFACQYNMENENTNYKYYEI